jgi:DNA-binding transcriptional LysR family regulator
MRAAMRDTAALSIDDFALFARVVELRNLSAVAREREVPPSQVSRALARIERQCGVRLIHRSTHGLALTEEGESLAAYGAEVLATVAELDAELDTRHGEPSGLVRVAMSPVMTLLLLPSLAPLLARHSRLRVEIAADDRLVDMAREGIDLAIRTGAQSDGLVVRPLGTFRRALYASPDYLRRRGRPTHPDELANHALIANSASPMLNRWPFVVDGEARELRPAGTLRTDNTGIVLAMALGGLGIARLVTSVAAPHVAAGTLERVLDGFVPVVEAPVSLVMLQERQRLPKVRACVDHWVDWFATRFDEP